MASRINTHVVKLFPRKIITPVAGVLALIIGLSGGLLFFHLGDGLVKGVHEWLGMLFVAVMVIHLLTNWTAFTKHFNQGAARLSVLSIIMTAGIFLGNSALSQQAGPDRLFSALEEAPVTTLALLFAVDEARLMQELNGQGVAITEHNQTLLESAALSGLGRRETLQKLLASVDVVQQKK